MARKDGARMVCDIAIPQTVLYRRITHKARVQQMTAQVHELLILDGQWTSIASDPPLPANHGRVVAASEEHRRKASSIVNSTACWRGYIATWQIEDDRFYLVSIEGRFGLLGAEHLLADWLRVSCACRSAR
jgi:hypothetical protein